MAKKESRNDMKAPKQAAPKISSLQISEPAPILDPPPAAGGLTNNDKMNEIIDGYEDGMMFVCTKETFDECMSLRLLGLPFAQMKVVKALQAEKSALFLFNMSDRRLHGLFHASSAGGANINRDAWNKGSSNSSPFPAQIEFVIARDCEPIHEKEFKHVFPDKHRIRKLDKTEVQKLVRLFLRDSSKGFSASTNTKRVPLQAPSGDKTISKPTAPTPAVKKEAVKVDSKQPAVLEKKSEPVPKAQPAFQWAAAPPKFAWGSKKSEKEEHSPQTMGTVEPSLSAPAPASSAAVEKTTVAVSAPESELDAKSNVTKPIWNEDDLWASEDSKVPTQVSKVVAPVQTQKVAQNQPSTPQTLPQPPNQTKQPISHPHTQPISQPLLPISQPQPQLISQPQPQPQPTQPQPISQPLQPISQPQHATPQHSNPQPQPISQPHQPISQPQQPISQPLQQSQSIFSSQQQLHHPPGSSFLQPSGGAFGHHGQAVQLPKVHQPSLFPSALFPPPPQPMNMGQPLQMHFDDSHWTQDTWGKDESVWGAAAPNEGGGWTSWGRSFDSSLLFGGVVANHVMDYAGEENSEQESLEYEEDLPHGPKCACSACMPNLPPNLDSLLEYVGLSDCYPNFAAEQMDIEALSMCDDTHLHEMNFVVGARVKLGALIRQLQKRDDLGCAA